MKRLKKILAVLLIVMMLSSCNNINYSNEGNTSSPEETSGNETEAKTEEVTTDDGSRFYTDMIDIYFKRFKEEPEGEITPEFFSVVECLEIDAIQYLGMVEPPNLYMVRIKVPQKYVDNFRETCELLFDEIPGIDYITVGRKPHLEFGGGTQARIAPNDPNYIYQWGLQAIDIEDAWEITQGSSSVTVGIIDTGIDGNHNDLKDVIDRNLSKDFTDSTGALTDTDGHGTHVAGIIGASVNNNICISGIAPNVKLVSLKILEDKNDSAMENIEKLIEAINYAQEKGIDILNVSLQIVTAPSDDSLIRLKQAINDYDGLVVCGAGNTTTNIDMYQRFPASFDCPNILVVGALSEEYVAWSSSNYGVVSVDIFAPGEFIPSCKPNVAGNNGFIEMSGTSMAAPHAAGVAALLLSEYSNMSAIDLKETIMDSASKITGDDPDDPATYDQYILDGLCATKCLLDAKEALQNPTYHVHTYEGMQNYDGSTHKLNCYCGETALFAHQYTEPQECGSLSYHKLLCQCGRDGGVTQAHTWTLHYGNAGVDASVNYVPEYICTKCGQTSLFTDSIL